MAGGGISNVGGRMVVVEEEKRRVLVAILPQAGGRLDVDAEGYGTGTPRGSRSGAGLELFLSPPPQVCLPPRALPQLSQSFLREAGPVRSEPARSCPKYFGSSLLAPRGRFDVDGDGHGLGTPRGSRSGAGLVLSRGGCGGIVDCTEIGGGMDGAGCPFMARCGVAEPPSPRLMIVAPGGRLDVDAEGYGTGTPRGSRSGAGLGMARVGGGGGGPGRIVNCTELGTPAVLGVAAGGRLDVDAEGYGLGTPRGSRSGAGLVLSRGGGGGGGAGVVDCTELRAPTILGVAPGGRLDVDGDGYGLGTPRGSRSGAGLVLCAPQQPRVSFAAQANSQD